MKTYNETVNKLAEQRMYDYLNGGSEYLYQIDATIAEIYSVTVVQMTADVNTRSAAMLADKQAQYKK